MPPTSKMAEANCHGAEASALVTICFLLMLRPNSKPVKGDLPGRPGTAEGERSEMIRRLLVANRGEISARILRTCRRLGIECVVVFSQADAQSAWVRQADRALFLGPSPPLESYLDQEKVLAAAIRSDCQAVHPGFGFLAENSEFAQRVQEAGLIWVGPSPASMELLGNKGRARRQAEGLGLPVIPGVEVAAQGLPELSAWVENVGLPVMIKAAAGGGGKGMRLVEQLESLGSDLERARSEAFRSFGDDALLLEKFLPQARHIEVQILGDGYGRTVHLGERDCSLQRRHQKIVEESPAVGLSRDLLEKLYAAALQLARSVDYQNAGTVEFLVSEGEFYFLEVNPRLQVEHPVTEIVTGLDLVEWQIRVAAGEPLPWTEVSRQGHALEVRLYAEDANFLPSTGTLLEFTMPLGLRVETGYGVGDQVTPDYDPLLAKLITQASSRAQALQQMARALEQVVVLGVDCNRDFLRAQMEIDPTLPWILGQPARPAVSTENWAAPAAALVAWLSGGGDDWSNGLLPPYRWEFEGHPAVEIGQGCLQGQPFRAQWRAPHLTLEWRGETRSFQVHPTPGACWVSSSRGLACLRPRMARPGAALGSGTQAWVEAPLSGRLLRLTVKSGDPVEEGSLLGVIEAMKMEHRLLSPGPAQVEEIYFQEGEVVPHRARILSLTAL